MDGDSEASVDASSFSKPRLLVVKGTFEQFGGAERDLLRNLAAWSERFDLHLASLNLTDEGRAIADAAGVPWITPAVPWTKPTGAWAEARAKASRSAVWAWMRMMRISEQGPGLEMLLRTVDAVTVTSGVGSLEIVPLIPDDMPLHLHMLEPHRGLYEDVLHRNPDGRPKRNMLITEWLLGKQRRRDQRFVRDFARTGVISANSPYVKECVREIYDLDCGVLLPSVDLSLWGTEPTGAWDALAEDHDLKPDSFVVTVGACSYVKGTWDSISMLQGSGLALVQVGGGIDAATAEHAESKGVRLVAMPRLTDAELIVLVRNARAVISHARGEPFGLTPIEAQAAGTPALMVDEGGFKHTVENSISGRLLARGDHAAWQAALEEAADPEVRRRWSKSGIESIQKIGMTPDNQALRLWEALAPRLREAASEEE